MRILLILFVFLGAIPSFAQRNRIDSLHRLLAKATYQDTLSIKRVAVLAYNYYRINPDSTIFFAEKGLQAAKKINYKNGIAECTKNLGIGHYAKSSYSQSMEYYQKALQLYEQSNNSDGMAACLNNIALIYNDYFAEYDKALSYAQRAVQFYKKTNTRQGVGVSLGNMGECYYNLKMYDKAKDALFKALEINIKLNNRNSIALDYILLSRIFVAEKNYQQAEDYATLGLKYAQEVGSQRDIANSLLVLGTIYKYQELYAQSENKLQTALKIAQNIQNRDCIKNSAFQLYDLYKQQKQLLLSLKYHELYDITKDSIFVNQKDKIIKNLEFSYQLQQQEQQIALLEKDKALQAEEKENQRLILAILVGALTLTVAFVLVILRSRQKKEAMNQLLKQKNIEVQNQKEELVIQAEQLSELNQLKDRLFSIIAHDLRSPINTLKGMLVILSMDSLSAEDLAMIQKNIGKQLGGIESTLNNLLQWAKNQMAGEASKTEVINLYQLIEEDIALLQATALDKQIILQNQVSSEIEVLADYQQVLTVFRNLLANAIKFTHLQGTVKVEATTKNKYIVIKVQDTGVGMNQEQLEMLFNHNKHLSTKGTSGEKGTGLGLILCKDFVEKNGGKIWVESKENIGTTFFVQLRSALA